MATDNKHVTWIDCLKGIGILSVVFAHVTDIKKEFVTKTLAKIKTWQTIGIIAALCVLLWVPDIYLDIKYNDYGIPLLSILLSILAVALVAVLSVKVSAVGTLERFLSFCGRGSLFIMFIHQFIHFRIFGNCNVWLGFVCTVTLSVGLYYIALRFALTRRFLCGEIRKP